MQRIRKSQTKPGVLAELRVLFLLFIQLLAVAEFYS